MALKINITPPRNYANRNPFAPDEYPNCFAGYNYAVDVVDGKIPACIYVRGACMRYFNMLLNPSDTWFFQPESAERYLRLVQKFEHAKGKWKTKNIQYAPWQKWFWMNAMGFIRKETGARLFRNIHGEVPRGNAKSTMAAQAVLYFLALDGESVGNEISTFATKKEQARIVLDSARSMAKKNTGFLKAKGVKVMQHTIVQEKTDSKARAMASKDDSLDGLQDILAVLDELHAMTRDTYDVITSGMSKRNDSMVLCITTAGSDTESVGATQSFYAKQICLGNTEDDTTFAVVYTIDEEDQDDIYNPLVWEKANPGWHESIDQHNFRAKALKTIDIAADLPGFKIKHLNMWLSEAQAYFDAEKLEQLCKNPLMKLEDFYGESCWMSGDMANKIDLCSVVYLFEKDELLHFFDKSYLPEATLKKEKRDIYTQSLKDGFLHTMPGNMIDQKIIKELFVEGNRNFRLESVALDPWNSVSLMKDLIDDHGLTVLEFGMKTGNLSGATKELQGAILDGRVRYNGSPLLKWNISNVVCKEDPAANVFPKKTHKNLKIDIAIAMIMALATLLQKRKMSSVYETRDLIII